MEALLLAITGLLNIVCFIIGAKVGQTVSKGERIETPNVNPLKAFRESRARKEEEMKQDKRDAILRNVERYDGTARGQEDVG
jgi:hypothetical protein